MGQMSFLEKLLNGAEVEWKVLGEVSEIYGGLTGKNKQDFENGNATYIPYKNIFDNIEIKMDKLESVKVAGSEKQHTVKYGDVLFTGSSERADEAGMSSAVTEKIENSIYLNSFSFGVRFNENITLAPEFLKYLFRSHFMRAKRVDNVVLTKVLDEVGLTEDMVNDMYRTMASANSSIFL
jgi:type I restriction enzyme S subunit